jgi:hypothetical protein
LRKATPDDLVILGFSGHGYADKQGRFYLLPSKSGTELPSEGGMENAAIQPQSQSQNPVRMEPLPQTVRSPAIRPASAFYTRDNYAIFGHPTNPCNAR